MAHIRAALAKVAEALVSDRLLLARARRRYKASRKRAYKAHNRKLAAQKRADAYRAKGGYFIGSAESEDIRASRAHHRELKNHGRAQVWLGRVKVLVRRVKGLEADQAKLEAELREWKKKHGVQIHGNEATGGTIQQRQIALALASVTACASRKRANFYSQSGATDVDHIVTGERYGERSDCSSYVTSDFKGAGLPDPNGGDYRGTMYTGTLPNGLKLVGEAAMKRHGCGVVLYGSAPYHHTELYIGPGDRTVGHGSAPVDFGVIDLFGDGDYDCFIYDPS